MYSLEHRYVDIIMTKRQKDFPCRHRDGGFCPTWWQNPTKKYSVDCFYLFNIVSCLNLHTCCIPTLTAAAHSQWIFFLSCFFLFVFSCSFLLIAKKISTAFLVDLSFASFCKQFIKYVFYGRHKKAEKHV